MAPQIWNLWPEFFRGHQHALQDAVKREAWVEAMLRADRLAYLASSVRHDRYAPSLSRPLQVTLCRRVDAATPSRLAEG